MEPSTSPARRRTGLVALLLVLAFALGNLTGRMAPPLQARALPETEEPTEFGIFWEAWDLVIDHFVDREKIDFKQMTYGAIRGMLATLGDEGHTTLLTPEELELHRTGLEGRFEGIGAYVTVEDGQVKIVSPIAGSPAEAAGLLPGDVVLAVDGQDVQGLTLNQVIFKIRGPAGTQVTLTVLHPDAEEPVDVVITRQRIVLDSVTWARIPGTPIAYIHISQFAADTGRELQQALQAIQQPGKGQPPIQGILLDLRNNPGGYVREAIRVGSQFLPRGETILIEEDANGERRYYTARGVGLARDIPMVVLVNQGTASAGEITAGALLENGRAPLVGQVTFGTGTVLNQFNLSDGSAILLGVANWLTPSGQRIKGQGVTPTVLVEQPASTPLVNARQLAESSLQELAKVSDRQFIVALEMLQRELGLTPLTQAGLDPRRHRLPSLRIQ